MILLSCRQSEQVFYTILLPRCQSAEAFNTILLPRRQSAEAFNTILLACRQSAEAFNMILLPFVTQNKSPGVSFADFGFTKSQLKKARINNQYG
jgi:hypothetical protein